VMYDTLRTVNKSGLHPNLRGIPTLPTSGSVTTSVADPTATPCGCKSLIPGVSNTTLGVGLILFAGFLASRKGKR